jgi:hypothetical protein
MATIAEKLGDIQTAANRCRGHNLLDVQQRIRVLRETEGDLKVQLAFRGIETATITKVTEWRKGKETAAAGEDISVVEERTSMLKMAQWRGIVSKVALVGCAISLGITVISLSTIMSGGIMALASRLEPQRPGMDNMRQVGLLILRISVRVFRAAIGLGCLLYLFNPMHKYASDLKGASQAFDTPDFKTFVQKYVEVYNYKPKQRDLLDLKLYQIYAGWKESAEGLYARI